MRFALLTPLVALALLTGCPEPDDTDDLVDPVREFPTCTDADGDGVCAEQDQDCDDNDPEVYLGRREVCNGKDDNCNGVTDEGLPDSDQDGICDAQDEEECDGQDNDGDSLVDEGSDDTDGDGIADCVDVETCDGVDNDGDGDVDEGFDADGDTVTVCGDVDGLNVDCDDNDAAVYPGATETTDAADNDCDGLVDEGAWAEGDLIITELMINPDVVGDSDGEWIELFNNSGQTVYLNGLQLRDKNGQSHTITSESAIALGPDDYAVMGLNGRPDQNGRVDFDYVYSDIRLSNQIDDLQVWVVDQTPAGENSVMIDTVQWNEDYPILPGAALTLEPGFTSPDNNDEALYWCPADFAWALGSDLGSPGEANPVCTAFDHDGDGFSVRAGDCDDDADDVYPGAPEIDSTVDNDCDGVAEAGPIASAKVETEVSETAVCGITYMDASDTRDPDGGSVVAYEWTLLTKPTGSTLEDSDIRNADRSFASFEADVSGDYEFQVYGLDEGDARGAPAELKVTIDSRTANTAPVADAGANQVASEDSNCVSLGGGKYNCISCKNLTFDLDGARSSDRDGDSLTYQWTVTSGPGTISDRTSQETEVVVSGATPVPDGRGVSTVFVDLTVTDCMGGTSTADTMAIVYTCFDR